jgi:hypothetical protein
MCLVNSLVYTKIPILFISSFAPELCTSCEKLLNAVDDTTSIGNPSALYDRYQQ